MDKTFAAPAPKSLKKSEHLLMLHSQENMHLGGINALEGIKS